jgi:c-di-GMP-binding flagellar brake protein YcgR
MALSNASSPSDNSMGYDITVLIDSKAVVEKKNFVATGTVTYVAGELLEIEFPQFDLFTLGEKVKIMIYAKGGIYVFESTVIAKDSGALVVLNPPENRRKFQDKRQDPRVPIKEEARLLGLYEYARKQERKFPDPPSLKLDNISISGIGLLIDIDVPLQPRNQLHLELDLGVRFECRTEIIHLRPGDEGIRCGTRIIEMPDEYMKWLRSYVMTRQIEHYYHEKAERIRRALMGDDAQAPAADSTPGVPRYGLATEGEADHAHTYLYDKKR